VLRANNTNEMNTEITLVEELIEETRGLLTRGKELLVKVAYNLHTLRESGEWKGEYETFPKYCQEVFELSQSSTSKYMAVAEYFSAKFLPEDIGPVAMENLYLSTKLPGSPEENLSKARTWSRDEFKQEKNEVAPHAFMKVCYCSVCGLSEERHP